MCQPRPAAAPGRFPAGQARIRRLPQHEIPGVALVGGNVDPRPGQQLILVAAGELAVFGEGGDGEQHMPFGRIGVARGNQLLAQRDHLRDVVGGARFDIRRQVVQRGHVGVEIGCRAGGDFGDALAALTRPGVDLVIHVGDVPRVGDLRKHPPQQPREDVEHHHRPGVAQMRQIIDRGAADIHPDVIGIDRPERFALPGEAVVEAELGHRGRSMGPKEHARKRVVQAGQDGAAFIAASCAEPARHQALIEACSRSAARARPIRGSRSLRSGPCSSPVSARRSGINSAFPLRPVAAFTALVQSGQVAGV